MFSGPLRKMYYTDYKVFSKLQIDLMMKESGT